MILITTSDYLPKLGGLTTFTRNVETVLQELNIPYELFHWNSPNDILNFKTNTLDKYDYIINIHSLFCWLLPSHQHQHHRKMINFIHGSEILMTSPNILKRLFKRLHAKKYFARMHDSHMNLFISHATQTKAVKAGFCVDYSRDLIFHNCIDLHGAQFISNSLMGSSKIVLICIARNVPHKNLEGAVQLAESVAAQLKKPVSLIVPKGTGLKSSLISIDELSGFSDEERESAFRMAHFNLLLSLDHSAKGFFEGFGLTVLEAGKFGVPSIVLNTGGLPEAVHDNITGHVLKDLSVDSLKELETFVNERAYQEMRKNCYIHTVTDHSLNEYAHFFRRLLDVRRSA